PGDSSTASAFASKLHDHIFEPLGLGAMFFDEAPLSNLPLGFNYEYWPSPAYTATAPGWALFPAYYGAAGMVATAEDMFKWLLFNMGIIKNKRLTPLLPTLQTAMTPITTSNRFPSHLGFGWFIEPATADWCGSVYKDGGLYCFSSYLAF